jgi:site-specific DNA-cytosine methylase
LDRLRTHGDYFEAVEQPFEKLRKRLSSTPSLRRRAVVLGAFAGVGTDIVCAKRLGIDIAKIIHVEIDKVATHVYRHNHDANYNPQLEADDTIEHVYEYQNWEALENNLADFVERHGPIDIVIGGPPCVDFSRVNAYRQGVEGEQGSFMMRFGRAIRMIERLQSPHPLFFVAENVWLSGDDRTKIMEAFGFDWDPIALDAQYLSPARRNRHFLTNIPLPDVDFNSDLSCIGPSSCLKEGFLVPAHIVDPEVTAKAQCFMACSSRIDERATLRMYVFKDKTDQLGRYHGRPMTVTEREKIMGYPVGYVERPGTMSDWFV